MRLRAASKMKKLKIIPQDKSLLNLQKFCTSKQILPEENLPKAVKVYISDDVFYLCQMFTKSYMHNDYCTVDDSVVCYKSNNICEEILPPLLENNINYLFPSSIEIVQKVNSIKSIYFTVILQSPELVPFWNGEHVPCSLIKDVLKMFLLTAQSYVFLNSIKMLQSIGIYCLFVNSVGNVEVGRIAANTKVKIVKVMSRLRFEQLYQNRKKSQFTGLEKHSSVLKEIIQNATKKQGSHKKSNNFHQSQQVLIIGPPGCGKTTLVNIVARDCRVPLVTINGAELSNALPGETEKSLKKVFQDAELLALEEHNGVCCLLIEQVDILCNKHDDSNKSHLIRCSNQLLSLLDAADRIKCLVVVATTDRVHLLDPAIRRPGRLDHEIHMGVPTQKERSDILKGLCLHLNLDPALSSEVACWTPGFVAADLSLLCFDVARFIHKSSCDDTSRDRNWQLSCWRFCLAKMQPSSLRGQLGTVDSPKISLDDIGGTSTIKQALKQAVEWPLVHSEAFARLGLPFPKGILLYGPPGCAKTSLVRAISASTNTTFLAVSAVEIYSPFVGDAERTIAQLFQKARIGAPTILFIDEIDALVGCRGDREQGSQERVLSAFLTEMDGVGIRIDMQTKHSKKELLESQTPDSSTSSSVKISKEPVNSDGVIVIAATNRPDMLDSALIRPGRFDKLHYVGLPSLEDRLDILKTLTKKMPLSEDVDLPKVADMTDLYSGADLNRLCKEAGLWALTEEGMFVEEIEQKHWLLALSKMKPSLTLPQIEWYKSLVIR